MTGYQVEAINRKNRSVKVRGNLIYMDKEPADAMVDSLQKTETGDMQWHRVAVDVRMEHLLKTERPA